MKKLKLDKDFLEIVFIYVLQNIAEKKSLSIKNSLLKKLIIIFVKVYLTYQFSRKCCISRRIILGIIASATHIKSDGATDLFTAAFGPCLSQNL